MSFLRHMTFKEGCEFKHSELCKLVIQSVTILLEERKITSIRNLIIQRRYKAVYLTSKLQIWRLNAGFDK